MQKEINDDLPELHWAIKLRRILLSLKPSDSEMNAFIRDLTGTMERKFPGEYRNINEPIDEMFEKRVSLPTDAGSRPDDHSQDAAKYMTHDGVSIARGDRYKAEGSDEIRKGIPHTPGGPPRPQREQALYNDLNPDDFDHE